MKRVYIYVGTDVPIHKLSHPIRIGSYNLEGSDTLPRVVFEW